jgi:teichuronic acid biosynthesis glycosyltransferase TuaC
MSTAATIAGEGASRLKRAAASSLRPNVLVLSRNYPSPGMPTRGLWAQRLAAAAVAHADVTVIAPVPWVPLRFGAGDLAPYARTPAWRDDHGTTVWHPAVPADYASRVHGFDVALTWPRVKRLADRLHAERRFSLVHAHFIYPDGVLAARLGERYGIPVVTTEHAYWRPWLDVERRAWRQVEAALPYIDRVTAVSDAVCRQASEMIAGRTATSVLPNVIDDAVFAADAAVPRDPNLLVFVGMIRRVKGLDLLVRALADLAPGRPALRLRVIGAGSLHGYAQDERAVRQLAETLGVTHRVEFIGTVAPHQVAAEMRGAALVVVPSRRESFCAVVGEALATGTPVVATRCGGPEEIITAGCGMLVAPDDLSALADAIDAALTAPPPDPSTLRASVVARFGWRPAVERLRALYASLLESPRSARRSGCFTPSAEI